MATNDVEEAEAAEALEEASVDISKDEGRRSLKLWFAVLGSPVAWAGHLGVNYSFEEWFACSRGTKKQGELLGLSVDTAVVLFNTAMLAVAALSGLVALRCWRSFRSGAGDEEGDEGVDDTTDRARWMAFAGMVEGALFVGIILLGYLPALMLGVCETSP
ncbi:MAG TPA: hypothetical protein VHF24_00560 [Acidimicrobiales bacterium]|jgi:hypothetical protein|nr:hypothetical protein [Acidimicrobiales bacterium]